MITSNGKESVDLNPLKIMGKVEIYMQDIIECVQGTLKGLTNSSLKA